MKICSNCGHKSAEYGVDISGTVPPDQVPKRDTCPNCGSFYNGVGEETWCITSCCNAEITRKMYRAQTGRVPPRGTYAPPDEPILKCPDCGNQLYMDGMVFERSEKERKYQKNMTKKRRNGGEKTGI